MSGAPLKPDAGEHQATILLRSDGVIRWRPLTREERGDYDPLTIPEQDRADIADEVQARVDEGRKAIAVEQAMVKWAVRLRHLGLGYQEADDRLQRYGLTLEQLAGVCPGCEVCRSMGLGPN
jgi:hypothetical protein